MIIGCLRIFLVIINIIFLILGLVLATAGIILAFFPGVVLDPIFEEIKAAAAANNFNTFASASQISDIPFLFEIGIFLMVLGLLLTFISFLGCFGSCCSCCRILLIVFAVVVLIFVAFEIIAFSLFLAESSPIHNSIRSNLKDEIPNPWNDLGTDSYTQALNLVNYNFDCCGIDGVSDFSSVPISCNGETVGCYSKLRDSIQDNMAWIGVSVALILLLQVLEAIAAIFIYRDSNNKVSPK